MRSRPPRSNLVSTQRKTIDVKIKGKERRVSPIGTLQPGGFVGEGDLSDINVDRKAACGAKRPDRRSVMRSDVDV